MFLASTRGVSGAVRLVVIKTLRQDLVNEPGYVTRFLDEARIVIQLQHANICQVFDVGYHDGVHFFAMEHIAGTNLRRLVDATGGAIPTALSVLIMAEALEGLDAAHQHKHTLTGDPLHVVHRDMSPHNVMISYDGEVKLIDFGLASSELKMEHTGSQVVLGKIAYMSPEQARGEPVDARSDQFSGAVVLYELLAGERYYGARTQREIWSMAGSRYVPPRLSNIEADLATILGRALAYEAKDRFSSCGDFAQALRSVLKLRFPFAERSSLRGFVREALVDDRAQTEESLRIFGQLALSALPEDGEPVTQTSAELPEEKPVSLGWQPAAIAAAGGLTIGIAGVLLALSVMGHPGGAPPDAGATSATATSATTPTTTAPATAATATAPPTATAPASTTAPTTTTAPADDDGRRDGRDGAPNASTAPASTTAPATAATPPTTTPPTTAAPTTASTPTGAGNKAADKKPRARSNVERRPKHRARPAAKPAWSTWSFAKKLGALPGCDAPCAKTLQGLRERGVQLMPAAVDTCLEQCDP